MLRQYINRIRSYHDEYGVIHVYVTGVEPELLVWMFHRLQNSLPLYQCVTYLDVQICVDNSLNNTTLFLVVCSLGMNLGWNQCRDNLHLGFFELIVTWTINPGVINLSFTLYGSGDSNWTSSASSQYLINHFYIQPSNSMIQCENF